MQLNRYTPIFLSVVLLFGTCLSATFTEPPGNLDRKNTVDGKALLAIRGLPLKHKMVGEVMSTLDFKKVRTVRDETHRTDFDGVVSSNGIEITTYFVAADKTVELVVIERKPDEQSITSCVIVPMPLDWD